MMIKIFIDTTAFKSEPLRLSKPFAQLTELSILGFIEIHLSTVNVDEIKSWIHESISNQLHSVNDCLAKAFNFKLSDSHYKKFQAFEAQATSILESTIEDAKQEFAGWLKNARVVIHDIENADGQNVMAGYFAGSTPFKQIKNRQDIPDAFIWESLKRYSLTSDDLFFVSADNIFRDKVGATFTQIHCVESLKKLFENEKIITVIEDWVSFTKRANADAVIELITYEVKLQKQFMRESFVKLIQDHFYGNKVHLPNNLTGEITNVRFVEEPVTPIDYVKVDHSTNVYLTFDCEVEFDIYVLVPFATQTKQQNQQDNYFDNVYLNSEISTDTHYAAEEYKLGRIYGELLIELPSISVNSGKEDVIEAIDECEIVLATLRVERMN